MAALVAHDLGLEIISADSRQVYRGLDIGTGKDLAEYQFGEDWVPVHLIDVAEPATSAELVVLHTNDTWGYYDPCG